MLPVELFTFSVGLTTVSRPKNASAFAGAPGSQQPPEKDEKDGMKVIKVRWSGHDSGWQSRLALVAFLAVLSNSLEGRSLGPAVAHVLVFRNTQARFFLVYPSQIIGELHQKIQSFQDLTFWD